MARHLRRRDIDQVYEALFMNMITSFEAFLEDLFVGLLVDGQGFTTSARGFARRTTIRTWRIAREMVIGPGGQYADWLPLKRTKDRANLFFRGGKPFTGATPADDRLIGRLLVIRNVIAHRSRFSQKKFETVALSGTFLPPRDRNPAGYLRSPFRANPYQTRYENLAADLLLLARRLAR